MKGMLIFHEKIIDESGNIVEMKIWKVLPSKDKPHGFKYSLVYIVDGERVIGYDNAEQKGDHRHFENREEKYPFKTVKQLADDFLNDVEQYKRRNP